MESRNITLTLDKAKEWYKKGGELKEFALQAYKEEELKIKLPETWEEFCNSYPEIKDESVIINTGKNTILYLDTLNSKEADAHLAIMQLHHLRDCYRQGWVPDWEDTQVPKYCIMHVGYEYYVEFTLSYTKFLSFQSREIAEKLLANFNDLIIKAGDLI